MQLRGEKLGLCRGIGFAQDVGKIKSPMSAVPLRSRAIQLKYCFFPFCLLLFVILWSASGWASSAPDQTSYLDFTRDDGFCLHGITPQTRWDPSLGRDDVPVWGSSCDNDRSQGRIVSDPFLAPPDLSFYLSGYAGTPGLRQYLHNLQTDENLDLVLKHPDDGWHLQTFHLPESWVGKPVEIIGEDRATEVRGWFGFTPPTLPKDSLAAGYIATNRTPTGFCTDSHFPQVSWGNISPPPGVIVWRSYCALGDKDTGFVASEPFAAKAYAGLYLAGYPGTPGVRLKIENLNTRQQVPLQVESLPRELWRFYYVSLPREWRGQPVRILAEDIATTPGGWVAFAVVRPSDWGIKASFGIRLLVLFAAIFLVTMVPPVAACFLAARRGVSSVLDLTAIALLTLGIVGYGAFWLYFVNRTAGQIYSWTTLLMGIAILLWTLPSQSGRRHIALLRPLRVPFLLVFLATLFVLSLGFIHGKTSPLQEYAARRFGPPFLSVDNWLPKILADDVYQNHIPKPMIDDWLSSDRPPLQAGNSLWNYAWTRGDREVAYQILGTILQFTFLAGLWAHLSAARANRNAMLLVMATVVFAGFTLENSFFVWPKLYPVGYLLIISAYLLTDRYRDVRTDWHIGLIVGASAALAMLCHGGSAFGLFGIAFTMLILRRVPSMRFIGAVAVAAIVLMIPWSLYQKYYDPPGDRLLKMHLAGTRDPHPEIKFSTLLVKKYKQAGWHGTLENKKYGFAGLLDDGNWNERMYDVAHFLFAGTRDQRRAEVASLRDLMFLRWFWSIDLLAFVVILWLICALVRRPRSPDFRNASVLWICTGFTLLTWCLLMFQGGTIVHQGCYFTEIAGFAAAVLTLWAISPRLAAVVVACHVALTFALYGVLEPPRPIGVGTRFGPFSKVLVITTVLSAAAFLLVLWRARNEGTDAAPHQFGALAFSGREGPPVSAQQH